MRAVDPVLRKEHQVQEILLWRCTFCFYFWIVQWGFEYQTSLVFKLSKVIQSPNCPVFECCLSTGLNLVQYSDHHLNTLQVKVPYLDVSIVQMFTKYSRDLKPGLAWIWTDPKEVDLQIVQILNGIWNLEAQPFKIWTSGPHYVRNHLKFWQKLKFFKRLGL